MGIFPSAAPYGFIIGILDAHSAGGLYLMVREITAGGTELDISLEVTAAIEKPVIIVDFACKWTGEFEIIGLLVGRPERKHIIICVE
jgi:hypothetical protein